MGKRSRYNTFNLCYICDRKRPCEREHVWPGRLGGKSTAPICVSCHDGLDRMNLDSLPMQELKAGWDELLDEFGEPWLKDVWAMFENPPEDITQCLKPFTEFLRCLWGFEAPARLVGMKIMRVLVERCGGDKWEAEPPYVADFCAMANGREESEAFPARLLPKLDLETDAARRIIGEQLGVTDVPLDHRN